MFKRICEFAHCNRQRWDRRVSEEESIEIEPFLGEIVIEVHIGCGWISRRTGDHSEAEIYL